MYIKEAEFELQREPFAQPFAFKGASFREKWNLVVRLRSEGGSWVYGMGGLAVLWSDARVFANHGEVGGNALMMTLLERGLGLVRGRSFTSPQAMLYDIMPQVYAYGRAVTRQSDLRPTFALNALVALDNAAWMLWAQEEGIDGFDKLIPSRYRPLFAERHSCVEAVPAVGYSLPDREIETLVNEGAYVLKVKVGHPGDDAEMLARDIARMDHIHQLVGNRSASRSPTGRVLYYLDANGRYPSADHLRSFIDALEQSGARERVLLFEEPFDETGVEGAGSLGEIGVPLAADESVHCVEDVYRRAEVGYGAMAVKAAGKTLSLAFDLVEAAVDSGLDCFVADNACVPLLVDWNRNIAARLPKLSGVRGGLMETNGAENYGSVWQRLLDAHPCAGASWLQPRAGAFSLDERFFAGGGGVFSGAQPYAGLFSLSP